MKNKMELERLPSRYAPRQEVFKPSPLGEGQDESEFYFFQYR